MGEESMVVRVARFMGFAPGDRHGRMLAASAIMAMRVPTEAMIDAGVQNAHGKNWGEMVAACHRAMIDAALQEKEG